MAEFILFNQNFSIPDSYIRDYKINKTSYAVAMEAKNEFYFWYSKCSGIEDVLKNYRDIAANMIEKYAVKPLFNSLKSFEIYDISDSRYVSLCVDCSEIAASFEIISSELETIIDDQNQMKQYRAARKEYRGRMVGGGFGLSGAIKGAVQAGAINVTTGMAHSAVNTIGNMGSSVVASSKKLSLYKNNQTKEVLATGICLSILKIYENHKELINKYCKRYFENGFDEDKAKALFENAMRISDKCESLLLESVVNYPGEDTLAYIFKNYKSERKNVYVIGEAFDLDFGKDVEETFAALYTDEVKLSAQKAEEIKNDILATMKEFGISSSDTLNQINYDELIRIAKKYESATDIETIQQYLDEFNKYNAPILQKKQVVQEKGIWQLAEKYAVTYAIEESERILERYYTDEARKSEEEAQNAKKKLVEIMSILNIQTSATYDQLEKDCIARICDNLENANEETCSMMRDKITQYDALEKNKKEYLDKIEKRIEVLWEKEDGEIFDNIYLNTDIYNQSEINRSLDYIRQKGRTANANKYIVALRSCNEKNIKNARMFQKKNTQNSNKVGKVLLIIGILGLLVIPASAVVAILGLVLIIRYNSLKKNWDTLTIDGTQIHSAIKIDNPEYTPNNLNRQGLLSDNEGNEINLIESSRDKMICSSCGKEINSSASFCKYCGMKIEK